MQAPLPSKKNKENVSERWIYVGQQTFDNAIVPPYLSLWRKEAKLIKDSISYDLSLSNPPLEKNSPQRPTGFRRRPDVVRQLQLRIGKRKFGIKNERAIYPYGDRKGHAAHHTRHSFFFSGQRRENRKRERERNMGKLKKAGHARLH